MRSIGIVSNPGRNVWDGAGDAYYPLHPDLSFKSRKERLGHGRPSALALIPPVSNPGRNVWDVRGFFPEQFCVRRFQIPEGTFGTYKGWSNENELKIVSNPGRNVWDRPGIALYLFDAAVLSNPGRNVWDHLPHLTALQAAVHFKSRKERLGPILDIITAPLRWLFQIPEGTFGTRPSRRRPNVSAAFQIPEGTFGTASRW